MTIVQNKTSKTNSTNRGKSGTTPPATPVVEFVEGTVVHVDPSTLLLARNVREAKPDAGLVASIKDLGVVEAITAVTTPPAEDGSVALLVRLGHRRTLAAIEAGRPTVPVFIAGADSLDKADEIARVISQRDENTHRTGLTTAEEVGVVETLTGLGLSAAQVAKRARIKRVDVDAALTVAASPIAKGAAARWEALTLDQSAVVAEFADDPETVKALVAAAVQSPGDFEHVAQTARDERAEAAYVARLVDDLTSAGVRVFARSEQSPTFGRLMDHKATKDAREPLTPETHAQCPGHAAYLADTWVWIDAAGNPAERGADGAREIWGKKPAYGCENPAEHGHVERWPSSGQQPAKVKAADMTEAQREEANTARRLVIENNKAWASAETVRRDWLAQFAQPKTAPKGTAAFIAEAIATDLHHLFDYQTTPAVEWLGAKSKQQTGSLAEGVTENRALVIALVQVLGLYEHKIDRTAWRENGKTSKWGRYLRFLETAGYTLSEVEKYAVSSKTV